MYKEKGGTGANGTEVFEKQSGLLLLHCLSFKSDDVVKHTIILSSSGHDG